MLLGAHLIPTKKWNQEDESQLARLQPKTIKILDRFDLVPKLHALSPRSLFVLRDWALSEQKSDVVADPEGTGRRHADDWAQKVQRVPVPREQLVVLGINEPKVWEVEDKTIRYDVAFLNRLAEHGIRGGALNLSVCWPVSWAPYAPLEDAIKRGNHFLFLHEYWDHNGVEYKWGEWTGRWLKCPWQVPIIIGECGLDEYVGDPSVSADKRGWKGWMGPDQYLAQVLYYEARLRQDPRIHSATPFTWDYNDPWGSFDVRPILHRLPVNDDFNHSFRPQPAPVPQPAPRPDTPVRIQPYPDVDEGDKFRRSMEFVFRWEGGYVNHPQDPGGETNFGITKNSYPHLDIKNLTKEQAMEIYRKDYWQKSGASEMAWPMCLMHFDASVNHGVGNALTLLKGSKTAAEYMANRIEFYTRIKTFGTFGVGWMRRMADLIRHAF